MHTLRAELTALFADAGITDVAVDAAVADEHMRCAAYLRVVAAAVARGRDRAVVAALLRDPDQHLAKVVVVELVDTVAAGAASAAEFQRWAAELAPEWDGLGAGHRDFVRRRIQDWVFSLTVRAGHTPTPAELSDVTDWMQRRVVEESASRPVLDVFAGHGRTRKIRRVAENRLRTVRSSAVR